MEAWSLHRVWKGFVLNFFCFVKDGGLSFATLLQKTPVIFVSHNYRLGPLGFPQGEEAKREDALNLGLKDYSAALQWVHENIEAFGGDKSKVKILDVYSLDRFWLVNRWPSLESALALRRPPFNCSILISHCSHAVLWANTAQYRQFASTNISAL